MAWLIWKKLEMTRIIKWDKMIPITLIKIPELKVLQLKTKEKDWYESVVLWENEWKIKKEFNITGSFKDIKVWDLISLDILNEIKQVDIVWISKWKWFAWAMKRYNFSWWPGRVGSKFHRALWSIGTRKPRRTKPWKKMHGHMWVDQITLKNRPLELVNKEISVIAVKWSIPWARNSTIFLTF